jgi:hypothetical protein
MFTTVTPPETAESELKVCFNEAITRVKEFGRDNLEQLAEIYESHSVPRSHNERAVETLWAERTSRLAITTLTPAIQGADRTRRNYRQCAGEIRVCLPSRDDASRMPPG